MHLAGQRLRELRVVRFSLPEVARHIAVEQLRVSIPYLDAHRAGVLDQLQARGAIHGGVCLGTQCRAKIGRCQ